MIFPETWIFFWSVESKGIFSDNPDHNILELYNILVVVQFAINKMNSDIYYNNLGIWLVSRGAKGSKKKSQFYVESA